MFQLLSTNMKQNKLMQELYVKNYKILLKEMFKDLKK
jgi:hypothetical protein